MSFGVVFLSADDIETVGSVSEGGSMAEQCKDGGKDITKLDVIESFLEEMFPEELDKRRGKNLYSRYSERKRREREQDALDEAKRLLEFNGYEVKKAP